MRVLKKKPKGRQCLFWVTTQVFLILQMQLQPQAQITTVIAIFQHVQPGLPTLKLKNGKMSERE